MHFKFKIITVGKNIHKGYDLLEEEYTKRLAKHVKLTLINIPDEPKTSTKTVVQIKSSESEKIIKQLKPTSTNILLDSRGENITTEDLANLLQILSPAGKEITFVIGGSHGVDKSIDSHIEKKIAFGHITLQHSLAKIVLLEQLFRCTNLLTGGAYHK